MSDYLAQQRAPDISKAAETPTGSQSSTQEMVQTQSPIPPVDSQPASTGSETDDEVEVLCVTTSEVQSDLDILTLELNIKQLENMQGQCLELLESYKETFQALLNAWNNSGIQAEGVVDQPSTEVRTVAAIGCSSSSLIPSTVIETESLASMERERSILRERCDYLESVNVELLNLLVPVQGVPDLTAAQQRKETEAALNIAFREIEALKVEVNILKARSIVVPNAEGKVLKLETDHMEPMDIDTIKAEVSGEAGFNLDVEELKGVNGESQDDASNSEPQHEDLKPDIDLEAVITSSSSKSVKVVESDALQENEVPSNEKHQVVEHMIVNCNEQEGQEIQGLQGDFILDETRRTEDPQIGSTQPEADVDNEKDDLNPNLEAEKESQAALLSQIEASQNPPSLMESDEREVCQPEARAISGNRKLPKRSGIIPLLTQETASSPSPKSGFYCCKCKKKCANLLTLKRHEGKFHNIWSTRRRRPVLADMGN